MNLIGNAVRFTRRGKVAVTIENTGHADDPELLIKIADTGSGMTEDLVRRVFDDFVTGNADYAREAGGTGLWLSIVKRFVNALGGDIGADSVFGAGSTFWVRLPVMLAGAQKDVQRQPVSDLTGWPLHVLLVEDNEINRIVAREMLQAEGHSVDEAHDGPQGVEAAMGTAFDLILIDISMPIMDGRAATRDALGEEVFAKLRARFVTEVDELQEWLMSDATRDFLELSARAHKVAGSAAVFGADPLREALKHIETAAKNGSVHEIRTNTALFATSWDQTKPQLFQ